MNLRPSLLVLCLLALFALPILCAAQTPKVWTPDPKLLAQLSPEVSVGNYKIRPPQGFIADPVKEDKLTQYTRIRYSWAHALPDGQKVRFFVDIHQYLPQVHHADLTQTLTDPIQQRQQLTTNFVQAPIQSGMVNGIRFLRFYWKGTAREDATIFHGIFYSAILSQPTEPELNVRIYFQGPEPDSTTSVALAEAAALTFRKG